LATRDLVSEESTVMSASPVEPVTVKLTPEELLALSKARAAFWIAILTAIGILLTSLLSMYFDRQREVAAEARETARIERDALIADRVAAAAVAATSVKETLKKTTASQDAKLDSMAEVNDANHSLLNGMTTAHLALVVDLTAEAAAGGDPAKVARATAAKKAFDEHVARIKAARK
jgi:hypothetical protein